MTKSNIRVLVVDDSPLMRRVIGDAIDSAADMNVVGTASDGDEAITKFRELKPDVVTLDMQMPGKNGLEVLAELLEIDPTPVIMVSSLTQRAAEITLSALDSGAVDYLGKPENAQQLEHVLHDELIKKIRASAYTDVRQVMQIRRNRKMRVASTGKASSPSRPKVDVEELNGACIAIGISTGGPPALSYLFESLAPPLPPIVVVQHMPQQFTGPFAERLNRASQLSIKEATTGDVLQPNHVLIAPGGKHLHLREKSGRVIVEIADGEPVCCHKPSVDVMMKCAAQIFRERCLGVIMTGMGRDGADGCRAVKANGGYVLGQDQATSDVYGMNKVAFTDGSVHEQFCLEDAPTAITAGLSRLRRSPAMAGAR